MMEAEQVQKTPSPLERDLAALLNRHGAENASDTPDWILADYLLGCLRTFARAMRQRERFCGREPDAVSGAQAIVAAARVYADCEGSDDGWGPDRVGNALKRLRAALRDEEPDHG